MELVNIEECAVIVKLDQDACLAVAEGLRRAAEHAGPGDQTLKMLWQSVEAGLQAMSFAASIYAEHDPAFRTARTFDSYSQRHIETLAPKHERPGGGAPPAA